MPITTIVFDFGNVIGFFDHRRAAQKLAACAGIAESVFYELLYDAALEDDYEAGRLTSAEFLALVRTRTGAACSDELIGSAYSDIFWRNEEVCALIPRLRPGYRLLLGSNTTELHSRRFRRDFADTLGHFTHLVLSHEIGVRKPDAGFFEHVRRKAQAAPQEMVFIDDLPANVATARACGWHGIVYRAESGDLHKQLAELGVERMIR
jgi:glucose-1-phosphatase